MSGFAAASVELAGRLTVAGRIEEVFPLFSPEGERSWVPGWDPETLHPPGASWERGMIFRTREETGDAVWIVTALDPERHEAEYHRVEPDRYVARVRVRCTALGGEQVQVAVAYAFVGLSAAGNAAIALMTREAYAEKMKRWEAWIGAWQARGGA